MFAGDLYTIRSTERSEGKLQAQLALNASHAIFEGHFPGQPVLPGACLLQIVKEMLETEIYHRVRLSIAQNIKFMHPVDPGNTTVISLSLTIQEKDDGSFTINAVFTAEEIIVCKINGVFIIID